MRKTALLATAASLVVSGMVFAQTDPQQPTVGQRLRDAASNTGDAAKNTASGISDAFKPDAENVKRTLQTATEAAVTKGGFDDLIERFANPDRDRIGKNMPSEEQQKMLDGRIDQIQKAWKAKYNQDFSIKDRDVVFDTRYVIMPGELPAANAQTAGDRVNAPNNETVRTTVAPADRTDRADAPKSDGAKTAGLQIPASHDLPALDVPFVHELSGWKIDVPDTVGGSQLYTNVIDHLTMVGESTDQWPADVNDAYRLVNHHLMMGILDKHAMPAGANAPMAPMAPMPPAQR